MTIALTVLVKDIVGLRRRYNARWLFCLDERQKSPANGLVVVQLFERHPIPHALL